MKAEESRKGDSVQRILIKRNTKAVCKAGALLPEAVYYEKRAVNNVLLVLNFIIIIIE